MEDSQIIASIQSEVKSNLEILKSVVDLVKPNEILYSQDFLKVLPFLFLALPFNSLK